MPGIAVVTGCTGYAAGWVVEELLEKGYTVRGTVRSTNNKEKIAHLTALGKALPGRLELHEAELLQEGSFDNVMEDALFVFHTASPFFHSADDPQKELIDPALKGTKNVLNSVAKHKKTIKRVVLTSSLAAMIKMEAGPDNKPRYTEHDWNTESSLENNPYMYSKTVAEKAAWDIAEKENLELVTIHPAFVIGPVLSSRPDGTSVESFINVVESKEASLVPWVCDVRDIAKAHVRAAEISSAKGRYPVCQPDKINPKVLTDALKMHFPQYKFRDLPEESVEPAVDSSRALRELNLGAYTDPRESIVDMATTLIQKGLAKPQKA